jgi:APA family basic amino acid/polyamine antiporter
VSRPRPPGALLRLLGVAFGVAVALGNTIGSGILKAPGEIASLLPSPTLFLGVWALGGLYALLSALSIAELGAMIPRAGGQYAFARRALGDYAGFVVGCGDWLSTCGSTAAAALVIGEYLAILVPALRGAATGLAIGVTVLFMLVQLRGVRLSGRVQELASLAKAIAFVLLIGACFAAAPGAPSAAAPAAIAARPLGVALVLALQAVIFTYDGWTGVIYFSEEVEDAARAVPRSLFLGVLAIAAIYLAINAALLRVASPGELAGSTLAVGVAAAKLFGGAGDALLRWLTLLSMIAALHAFHLMATRVLYGMARDGLFFGAAAQVNSGGTPALALFCSAAVAVAFILSGTFEQVIAVLSFFFVANYSLSFLSLFVLRRREPRAERPFRVPLYPLPTALTLLGSLAFLGASIASDPRSSRLALLLLSATAPIFLLLRRRAPQPNSIP